MFSVKLQVSLSAVALQFYSLHVTLLNISKEHHREVIANGRTAVAYLPVMLGAREKRSHQKFFGATKSR